MIIITVTYWFICFKSLFIVDTSAVKMIHGPPAPPLCSNSLGTNDPLCGCVTKA